MRVTKDYFDNESEDDELTRLRKENNNYRLDNLYKLFFAMNRKSGEIADGLNDTTLQFDAKDDKVFDRFLKLIDKLEPLVRTLAALRQEYLKVPEDEVDEMEKKGIPPIERRAKNKK